MSIKGLIKRQFSNGYDENGWFVALRNALNGVTAEQATWKAAGIDNSIWQSVSHLNFYNYAYVERFKGMDYEYPVDDNDATFTAGGSDEEWADEIARLDAVLTEFRELIESSDDAKFAEPVSASNQTKWATLILNIAAHNAYHAGQIMLLRKLQGNWDRSKGVS